jgi:hypothetical protein
MYVYFLCQFYILKPMNLAQTYCFYKFHMDSIEIS